MVAEHFRMLATWDGHHSRLSASTYVLLLGVSVYRHCHCFASPAIFLMI
jgi:hypothetical protein